MWYNSWKENWLTVNCQISVHLFRASNFLNTLLHLSFPSSPPLLPPLFPSSLSETDQSAYTYRTYNTTDNSYSMNCDSDFRWGWLNIVTTTDNDPSHDFSHLNDEMLL